MANRVERAGLKVDKRLAEFVEDAALPGTGVDQAAFWEGFRSMLDALVPVNRALLATRERLQAAIDDWHRAHRGRPHDAAAYRTFLEEIGYLVPEPDPFEIETKNVDPEIATIAGPQLVVPITNARYALNAVNARWGSLYDALYGTDAMGSPPPPGPYDAGRGARVIARARVFLDDHFPLVGLSHAEAASYAVDKGRLLVNGQPLVQPEKFVGYIGDPAAPEAVILKNHGLHVILEINRAHPVGANDRAGISDIKLEAALTAIMDCEDSVACVDAEDKVMAYGNWLGLMQRRLEATFEKNGLLMTRRIAEDIAFTRADGSPGRLRATALLWVRNVGHLMTNPAIHLPDGSEVPEGLMDALITTLAALHDLRRPSGPWNTATGSIYVVKPKMHGPEEVAFACTTFDWVEDILGLPRHTVKIGLMDEERRTSANLKACIFAARHRLAFINTGFLDRTGDEIHTSMEAGPVSRKAFLKRKPWYAAYEMRNVDIGLECGLASRAQIGKGMWAAPDLMAQMLEEKIEHPRGGASTAWVPSPTAATLHALHYHKVDVATVQAKLRAGGRRAHLEQLLELPLASYRKWTPAQIRAELENNAQGILGYVVRWIDQGIGCSKVPDINDIGLMEDRATCRISSQHIANWLYHGVVSEEEVIAAFKRMAAVVDRQNAGDPNYVPMAPGFDGPAFQAALELVLKGRKLPSGYTEPVLHAWRLRRKAETQSHRAA